MRNETERYAEEILTDKILLLSLFCQTAENSDLHSVIKAQKLAFIPTVKLFRDSQKAFSLEFYRYNWGPMSKAVYDCLDDFSMLGFLKRDGENISQPFKEARELVRDFEGEVFAHKSNGFCFKKIKATVKQYGHLSPFDLKDVVYRMKLQTLESSKKRKMDDIPKFEHFTKVLEDEEASDVLYIPPDWMHTLSTILVPENVASLQRAEKSKLVGAKNLGES